ncbi:hypothetical protein IL252_11435 [Halomicrobium sp. IBSBa]|uniref:hypothetical protein n=1 Tax=Halomicrobium sp. IBSBa TaxID=2778916 RepID=UPI001ABF862B|nr:hypothetical protein [Halomicrobium sp. IBSBa]MBO4248427.1 hypothetical protein [Halomicrobium sp. IBSBa]
MADEQSDRTDSKTTLLDRRDALKVLGGTALVGMGVGSVNGQSETESFVIDASEATWSYVIETTGDVTRVPTDGEVDDSISDGTIQGTVSSGLAAYELAGDVTALTLDGPSTFSFGPDAGGQLEERHEIAISSPTEVAYELTTTGEITKLTDVGTLSAETENDVIAENDDGTYTVTGYTGNGYGDSYEFLGSVVAFSPKDADANVTLDGDSISPYDLVGEDEPSQTLAVVSQTEVSYEFTVDGSVEKVLDAGRNSAETENDVIAENDDGTYGVAGYTGNGYGDSYEITGEVSDFAPVDGDYTLYLDGDQIALSELTGQESTDDSTDSTDDGSDDDSTESTSPVIGGGDGYADAVEPRQATVTVDSVSELVDALGSATSGDVVYVDGSAELDLGSRDITVPAGVTLASDRGVDGAAGGHLYTTSVMWPLVYVSGGARVTGLRVSGPSYSYREYDADAVDMGLRVTGSGVEIDNNEIWGFTHAAVRPAGDTHVHHNHVHHNPMDGLGYGVSTTSGQPLIEYNEFNYNRHSIASGGGNGYVARYNHFGSAAVDHVMDMHRPGGTTIEIHHNTVEAVTHVQDSGRTEAVAIRGTPSDVADIHGNWFYNPNEPKSTPEGWDGSAITQVHTSSWQNVEFRNNHYGSDEPAPDIGCPR